MKTHIIRALLACILLLPLLGWAQPVPPPPSTNHVNRMTNDVVSILFRASLDCPFILKARTDSFTTSVGGGTFGGTYISATDAQSNSWFEIDFSFTNKAGVRVSHVLSFDWATTVDTNNTMAFYYNTNGGSWIGPVTIQGENLGASPSYAWTKHYAVSLAAANKATARFVYTRSPSDPHTHAWGGVDHVRWEGNESPDQILRINEYGQYIPPFWDVSWATTSPATYTNHLQQATSPSGPWTNVSASPALDSTVMRNNVYLTNTTAHTLFRLHP